MKILFLEAKYTGKINLNKIKADKLPERIGLVTTVQFVDYLDYTKSSLKDKKVFIGEGKQKYKGQVLGCDVSSAESIKTKVNAFLYIGTGRFHPLIVAVKTGKDVFCFNPVSSLFSKLKKEDIEKYNKRKKARYVKFLHSDNIGILVSTKPGQNSYKKAVDIKKKLENEGKKCFIFVFDTLDASEMENFPFIDCWVNTACPRIADDPDKKNIINMSDLELV